MSRTIPLLAALAVMLFSLQPVGAVTIDWVPVGNPGNAADPATGYGAVGYEYTIGKYEVTNSQYAEFLNAVAVADTYSLYNANMGDLVYGGIYQFGYSGGYSYSAKTGFGNLPVIYVSWGDAARFANWLANGQPTGAQDLTTTESGSYYLNGAVVSAALNAVTRESEATIVIPNENEWYKAAYNNPAGSYFQYPTSSNTTPSNAYIDAGNNANFKDDGFTRGIPYMTDVGHFALSASPYGTFDQGGNVFEWNEASIGGRYRGMRGGSWRWDAIDLTSSKRNSLDPAIENYYYGIGFRVATAPEPSTAVLAAFGFLALAAWGWRRRKL